MNFDNKKPIYENIVTTYKEYIDLGVYKVNDKLPSVRSIADLYGINPNTVQKSFNILEKDGYVQTIPKKGIYVKKDINVSSNSVESIVKDEIRKIKKSGITKDELLKIMEVIYNDWN